MPTLQWSPSVVRRNVQSKKPRAATGMDGVSRADGMPDSCITGILHLFEVAEQSGRWPSQFLHGAVSALQKHESSAQAQDYRPITIFPFLYRTWSSVQSRRVLAHLSKFAPLGITGNRSGSSSVASWWQLQLAVEYHLMQGIPS